MEELDEIVDFFFLFGSLSIAVVLTALFLCLECCCYSKAQFPREKSLQQENDIILRPRPRRVGKTAVIADQSNKLILTKRSMNAIYQHKHLHFEENYASPAFFPMITAWPLFHCLFFLGLPVGLITGLTELIATQNEDFIFFNASGTSEMSFEKLKNFDVNNILAFVGNSCFWLGSVYFGCSFLANFFLLFSTKLTGEWFELLPLSYGRRLNSNFLLSAFWFFVLGLTAISTLTVFTIDQSKRVSFELLREHPLAEAISRTSLITALILVLLFETFTFRGLYVFLSFIYCDFIAKWKVIIYLCQSAIIVYTILLLSKLNDFAGLIIITFFLLFTVIPFVMNALISLMEVHKLELVAGKYMDDEDCFLDECDNEEIGFRIYFTQFEVEVRGKQKFGYVGQKLPISLISKPFSTAEVVISDIEEVTEELNFGQHRNLTKLKLTYIEVQPRRAQYIHLLCPNWLRVLQEIICCICLVPFWMTFYFSFFCFGNTVLGIEKRNGPVNVKFGHPIGRPLPTFYEFASDTHNKRARLYSFYADDYGFQQALAHYMYCLSRNYSTQFTFYCSDFRTLAAIVLFLFQQDYLFYEQILQQERSCDFFNFNFVLQNTGIKPDKTYIKKLSCKLADIVSKRFDGMLLKDTELPNFTSFLCERMHIIGSKFGYLPDIQEPSEALQGAGSSHYFCFLGSSELALNLKPRVKKRKPHNPRYFESVTEPSFTALPYARFSPNYYKEE